jgi:hypothetical protein
MARAIERRKPRVIAPRYWTAMSLLRGLINPAFDFAAPRLARVLEIVREADVDNRLGPRA